jgi:hypothetical protein
MDPRRLDKILAFAAEKERGKTTMAKLCRAYGFSRARGYWLLRKLQKLQESNTPLTVNCFPKRGRPREIPSELGLELVGKIKHLDSVRNPPRYTVLPWRQGHKKEAREYLSIGEIRMMARALKIECSDNTLRRFLARKHIRTIGQMWQRRRSRRLMWTSKCLSEPGHVTGPRRLIVVRVGSSRGRRAGGRAFT